MTADPRVTAFVRQLLSYPPQERERYYAEEYPKLSDEQRAAFDAEVKRQQKANGHDDEAQEKKKRPTIADDLIRLTEDAQLFRRPAGLMAYADIMVAGHRETWPVRSKEFKDWLVGGYFRLTRKAPNSEALQQALNVVDAKALDAPEIEVFVRVAELNGRIYIDLANGRWEAIEIDSEGWRVVPQPAVRFRRRPGMKALATPVFGGTVKELWNFLNIATQAEFCLIVSWLLAAMRSEGPFPILAFFGEMGSAKSVLCEALRRLIDPNKAMLRPIPKGRRRPVHRRRQRACHRPRQHLQYPALGL